MARILIALAIAFGLSACAPGDGAQARQSSNPDREAIEQIVREYLVENPEVIEEALIELQRRRREAERMAQVDAIDALNDRIYADARDPSVGPADAAVTIVEFVDYRCSFCAISNTWLQGAIDDHGDEIRVVFKEFPLRGPDATEAARAGLAVWRNQPDLYLDFHNALFDANGPLPSQRIDEIAESVGVDVDAMRSTMDDDAITEQLAEVRQIGTEIGVRGTPFFIVGGTIIPGADLDALDRALNDALNAAG
jgi:protein-disulfide isomerase